MVTSVSRGDDLACEAILEEGLRVIEARASSKKKELYGWLELDRAKLSKLNLRAEPDEPPPRHEQVVNWPHDDDLGTRRQKHLKLAKKVAALCSRVAVFDPPLVPGEALPADFSCCEASAHSKFLPRA